jgi:hypothetical protein
MRTPCCLPSFASNWTKSETRHLREVSPCPFTVLTMPESKAATQKLHLLVPNEDKRKNYLRLFKWVVSFATWRYGADSTSGLGKGDGVDDAGYTLQARDCTSSRLTALFLGLWLCPVPDTRVSRQQIDPSAVSPTSSRARGEALQCKHSVEGLVGLKDLSAKKGERPKSRRFGGDETRRLHSLQPKTIEICCGLLSGDEEEKQGLVHVDGQLVPHSLFPIG